MVELDLLGVLDHDHGVGAVGQHAAGGDRVHSPMPEHDRRRRPISTSPTSFR